MQSPRLLVLAPVSLLSILGCERPAPSVEAPRPVRTITAAPAAATETLVQTGSIAARRTTELGFPVEGRLNDRFVEVGAHVHKGAPLARLEGALIQNEIRSAEAELASAAAALELATATSARQKELHAAGSASVQQVDEARAAVRAAAARRDAAAATLGNAKQRLAYTTLFAPEDGVVTAVSANRGQFVGPQSTILVLASAEREAVFDVAEKVMATAPANARVAVRLVSDPDVAVTGTVREQSPAADPVMRTYRVRVALPEAPARMAIGAAVRGVVELPSDRAMLVPSGAVTSEGDALAVYVVGPGSMQLARRRIQVTRMDREHVVVASGLAPGDRVVVAGVGKLRPGQLVALEEVRP